METDSRCFNDADLLPLSNYIRDLLQYQRFKCDVCDFVGSSMEEQNVHAARTGHDINDYFDEEKEALVQKLHQDFLVVHTFGISRLLSKKEKNKRKSEDTPLTIKKPKSHRKEEERPKRVEPSNSKRTSPPKKLTVSCSICAHKVPSDLRERLVHIDGHISTSSSSPDYDNIREAQMKKAFPEEVASAQECVLCGVKLRSLTGRESHVASTHYDEAIVCPMKGCVISFANPTLLKRHLKTDHMMSKRDIFNTIGKKLHDFDREVHRCFPYPLVVRPNILSVATDESLPPSRRVIPSDSESGDDDVIVEDPTPVGCPVDNPSRPPSLLLSNPSPRPSVSRFANIPPPRSAPTYPDRMPRINRHNM